MAAMGLGKGLLVGNLRLIFLLLCFIKYVNAHMDMEELKSIYYGMDILNEPVMINQDTSVSMMQVTSKYGQRYQCSSPDHTEAEKKKEEEEKVAVEMGIVEMLKAMKSRDCLRKTKDWWTYEFCYGKYLRQYHMEDGIIRGNVIHLGFYDSDFDWHNETAKEERLKTTLASYHSQSYNQGDKCDLTGRPREVEIRFMCEENSEDYLSRIEESETCVYTVTVMTSRICRHPYLRPPIRRKGVLITCNPLLTEQEFNQYMIEENERKEAERLYRIKREEGLRNRKSTMDQELEDSLIKTAKEVLSEPAGSLFPQPGADGKVSRESFQKRFGPSEQQWELYQKALELSQKTAQDTKQKIRELQELKKREEMEGTSAVEEEEEGEENTEQDKEDDEILSQFSGEIDDIKNRFKKTQKKLSSIKKKLSDEKGWEESIEKAIEEAEEELGMKLDRTLVSGLSTTLNKLVNKLQDTEAELSSMDKEINGLDTDEDEDSDITKDATSESVGKGKDTAGSRKLDPTQTETDDSDNKNKKKKNNENILKGEGFGKDTSGKDWQGSKQETADTATRQPHSLYDDKIKSPPKTPPRSTDEQNIDYSDKKLEVPSTFPLPKDPTQDVVATDDDGDTHRSPSSVEPEENLEGADTTAVPKIKLTINDLDDGGNEDGGEGDDTKIPPNIKELLEDTVLKEYEKKTLRKGQGKLGLDDDHSFIQDKSIHVIQQEDKDGNTNRFIFVLGFKNVDDEAAEQDKQSALEDNYGFVFGDRKQQQQLEGVGSSGGGGREGVTVVGGGEGEQEEEEKDNMFASQPDR